MRRRDPATRFADTERPLVIAVVHGGVAGIARSPRASLAPALAAASACGDALDAVEAAVKILEDEPAFNAGTGAVLNRAGRLELDAGICDGFTGRFGAVAGVGVRNPVTLARRVMDDSPHVFLVGEGAMAVAPELERAEVTLEQRRRWEDAKRNGLLTDDSFGDPEFVDTVGAVALGPSGRLAAASSTGGVFGKLPGRVGDAPVLGAGVFASRSCAVVGTGVGEVFLRSVAALRAALRIEQGEAPAAACRAVIGRIVADHPVALGLLALTAEGRAGAAYHGGSWQVEGPGLELERVDARPAR